MPQIVEAKSIQIVIRLGSNPQFQIAADDRVTVNPSDFKFRVKGLDSTNAQILADILDRLRAAYPNSTSLRICTDGTKIVSKDNCGL